MKNTKLVILGIGGITAALVLYYGVWMWGVCRHYSDAGSSLLITRKTGIAAGPGSYAAEGQQGVLEEMRGPGRHFFNPWVYDTSRVPDLVIKPEQIGIVTSKVGGDLASGRFLADEGQKGVQRQVLTPGAWRINTHGAQVQVVPATVIQPGYVGVQTRLGESTKGAKGILPEVLPPGYHNINPKQTKVDTIEVGYRELTFKTTLDRQAIPKPGSGISFPTRDGFRMFLDLTVVWGLLPENAPRIIREYGNIDEVEEKIIGPQIDSICKLNGSKYTVQQFILGADREKFQEALIEEMRSLGNDKGIEFLLVLVRGIYPPKEVREPIQQAKIAEEEKASLKVQEQTDKVAAQLEEAHKLVEITVQDYTAETRKLVAGELAKGQREAAGIEAETDRQVAEIEAQVALLEAQTLRLVGQAKADVVEALRGADADRFKQQVAAYGGGASFSLAQFAEGLPEDLQLEYRYSGPGTFWTDSAGNSGKNSSSTMVENAARVLLSNLPKDFPDNQRNGK